MSEPRAIKIAINALGGQGGGVLANWIVRLGEKAGYIAQATSVPGVAQRTGATVYYIELFPEAAAQAKGKPPVLALMPVPGDVDIVIASEMMEAGRALARGFVSNKTTLIASSHRVYAIGEKIAMGDGRENAGDIEKLARKTAGRFVLADMDAAAKEAGAVISAALFGALAGSGALPIGRAVFEETIREAGRSVDENLDAFNLGCRAAQGQASTAAAGTADPRRASDAAPAVQPLLQRLARFPAPAHYIMREGLKKVVDYQGVAYGALYLERLQDVRTLDERFGGERRDWALLKATAKYLALWMAYDDVIRVADLKTRGSRFVRFREDVKAAEGQIVHVSEYMHPRAEEFCDLLPAGLAEAVLKSSFLRGALQMFLGKGRRVSTTKLRGFFLLNGLASLRFMRRWSFRYRLEARRIDDWLSMIVSAVGENYALACEIAALQRLLKGYGETHERGLASYNRIVSALDAVRREPDPAAALKGLCEAALQDEDGGALAARLDALTSAMAA